MGEITRTVHQMRDEPDNPPDPNDRASQETTCRSSCAIAIASAS
jgi:hypothetical protein